MSQDPSNLTTATVYDILSACPLRPQPEQPKGMEVDKPCEGGYDHGERDPGNSQMV